MDWEEFRPPCGPAGEFRSRLCSGRPLTPPVTLSQERKAFGAPSAPGGVENRKRNASSPPRHPAPPFRALLSHSASYLEMRRNLVRARVVRFPLPSISEADSRRIDIILRRQKGGLGDSRRRRLTIFGLQKVPSCPLPPTPSKATLATSSQEDRT